MRKLKDFTYTNVLVLGLAKSGTAAALFLIHNGKKVRVNDMKASENNEAVAELKKVGAEVVIGSHPLSVLEGIERSEEHTSELQSRGHLVCRLLLEKKKDNS